MLLQAKPNTHSTTTDCCGKTWSTAHWWDTHTHTHTLHYDYDAQMIFILKCHALIRLLRKRLIFYCFFVYVFLLTFIVFNLITHDMKTAFQLLSMLFCRLWMFWWAAEVLVSLRRSPLKCWIVTPSHRWRRRFWSRHGRARHTSRDPRQTLCIWVRAWHNVQKPNQLFKQM